jgi:hypothetical protein
VAGQEKSKFEKYEKKKPTKNCAKQFLNVEIAQRPSAPPLRTW